MMMIGRPAQVKSVRTLIAGLLLEGSYKGGGEYSPACTYATAIETSFE